MWRYMILEEELDVVEWAEKYLFNPHSTTVEPLRLYDWQKTILRCGNRHKMVRSGRLAGATACSVVDAVYNASTGGRKVLYLVPTTHNIEHIMHMIDVLVGGVNNFRLGITRYGASNSGSFRDVNFGSGGGIVIKSAYGIDRGHLRGRLDDNLYVDNAEQLDVRLVGRELFHPGLDVWINASNDHHGEYGDKIEEWTCDGDSLFRCGNAGDCDCGNTPCYIESVEANERRRDRRLDALRYVAAMVRHS